MAARLGVGRSSVYGWAARYRSDRRTAPSLADRPRAGRQPKARRAAAELAEAALASDPRAAGYRQSISTVPLLVAHPERSVGRDASGTTMRRARTAWAIAGSSPVSSSPAAHPPGGRQRGAEARAGRAHAHRRPVLRRHNPRRVAAAARRLGEGRRAGQGADHRQPRSPRPVRGDGDRHRHALPGPGGSVEPGRLPVAPAASPLDVARLKDRPVRGPRLATHGEAVASPGGRVGGGAAVPADGVPGAEPARRAVMGDQGARPG
ncbi:hypothetical protein [Tautonia rosea]|uniref:hypothetical protein n=1 Tax=Tautonia rosea TaxID=2728037 RepID=UPI001473B7EF|nr:hypothetical protein [Tautonia rosea]